MHRTWFRCLLFAALATATLAVHSGPALAAAKSATSPSSKSKNSLHQFTGIVTALDKQSLTVEKRGKKPSTRTFARHEEMAVTGDLAREARVTVYYRDEGGKSVARRVVVKAAGATASR
ncbi:MAG: hypothetical protein ABIS67_06715 [Candidatus Eisenbacteria bacterium]